MSNYSILLVSTLTILLFSGCASQTLDSPQIIYGNAPEPAKTSQPLQIATWSPTKYNGRFTAMGSGYLTIVENCLAMTKDNEEVMIKDNTYLL